MHVACTKGTGVAGRQAAEVAVVCKPVNVIKAYQQLLTVLSVIS